MTEKDPHSPQRGPLNWNSIRLFVSAAQQSSIAAAAADLNIAPATIRRAIKDLEDRLGFDVFQRTPQGLVLTDSGREVFSHSLAMAETAQAIKASQHPRYGEEAGMVKISALQAMSEDVIASQIGTFIDRFPKITLDLNVDTYVEDPASSDTDITLNYTAPSHPSLVPVTIGQMHYVFFASRSYLDKHGEPDNLAACLSHRTVMMTTYLEVLQQLSPEVYAVAKTQNFNVYTNTAASIARACASGVGVGVLPSWSVELDERLVPLVNVPAVPVPIKMCALERTRERKAVQCVMGWLKELFSADRSIHFHPEFKIRDLLGGDLGDRITDHAYEFTGSCSPATKVDANI